MMVLQANRFAVAVGAALVLLGTILIVTSLHPSCTAPHRAVPGPGEPVPQQPTGTHRGISVGQANLNDQNLRDADWRYALRFVLDADATLHRFFIGFRAAGAGGVFTDQGVEHGYGAGTAGIVRAELVPALPDGTPDLDNAVERAPDVPAAERYAQTRSDYAISGRTGMIYVDFGGVPLRGGVPYFVVVSNADDAPAENFFSINSPVLKASEAGPNGTNTLDAGAGGAIAGLDPREAVAWSTDGGESWVWGMHVGRGYYQGSPTTDDGARIPWYGWTEAPGPDAPARSNQPYMNYDETCTGCTLTLTGAPRGAILTHAGGYAPVGHEVGVVTVRNLRTGVSAHTAALGSGIVRGRLDRPVCIGRGDSFTISTTGTVFRNPADGYLRNIFRVGSEDWPFTTDGTADRAQLFALPDPFHPGSARPARSDQRRRKCCRQRHSPDRKPTP